MIQRSKLKRCRELRHEADLYREKLEEMQPSISVAFDAMPRGNQVGHPTEKTALDIIGLQDLMIQIIEEHERLVREIVAACMDISSSKRQVILLRYVDDMSWEEVADKMAYSVARIMQLHKEAVSEISYEDYSKL